MFHVKHLTVRQGRQALRRSGETGETGGQYSGGTGGSVVRSQVRQARQALRQSVAQVRQVEVGAPHIVLARPYAKSVPYCFNFC